MLQVEHLTTGYDKKPILTDVSFSIKSGETVLLSGNNGSGKSTILKAIYGLLPIWEGHICFNNINLAGKSPCDMLAQGIAYMPQDGNVFDDLTIEENLLVASNSLSISDSKKNLQYVYGVVPFLGLHKNQKAYSLSGGEKKLLAFSYMLIHKPKLLLLDEPLAATDVYNSNNIKQGLIKLKNETRCSILIIEHSHEIINDIVDRKIQLKLGKLNK